MSIKGGMKLAIVKDQQITGRVEGNRVVYANPTGL
jgi:hypothetical protein